MRKPRLLIIGHARHGKDTVAQKISDLMGLKFSSSSMFVGERCIWPSWGKERYKTFEEMFKDRVNYRQLWGDLISAYNTPNKARTAAEMLELGNDMYVGMRRDDELQECNRQKLFDHIIWVDASGRVGKEPKTSMMLHSGHADIFISNNSTSEDDMDYAVKNLQKKLHEEGFEVQYVAPKKVQLQLDKLVPPLKSETPVVEIKEEPVPEKSWEDAPEGAVKVLDHGFFIVRGHMGTDHEIAESARMSYGRGTKKVSSDKGLIRYLIMNKHTSPLEMGEVKVHMRLPIFVMRQLVRHRTANLNEYSGRYSEMVRLYYVPEHEQICHQDKVNKQGSADPLDYNTATDVQEKIIASCNEAFDTYEDLLQMKVSRETARMVLPLNVYTEVVWKIDVSNLIKLLYLRDDPHSQWEIRQYAVLLSDVLAIYFPLVYEAYLETRQMTNLTPMQVECLIRGEVLDGMPRGETEQVRKILKQFETI